jgi:phage-related protein
MIDSGIYFGNIHSFYDLNLVLSAVSISPAKPKTSYIDIPGSDGSIDTTEVHGSVKYNDRDCKFTLTMNPDGDLSESAWEEKKTQIANALNGKYFERITLDKNPEYYYSGRCSIEEYLSNKKLRQFVVTAKVRPYKMRSVETVATFSTLPDTEKEIRLNNEKKAVCPMIKCTAIRTIITFNGQTFNLSRGERQVLDIQLTEGENKLTVKGGGEVTFRYREGAL